MSDIELRNVDSTAPLMRSLSKQEYFEGEHVDTDHGPVYVIKAGAPPNSGKPYLVTYHDLGLNFASNFQAFFNFFEMKILLRSFSVLNIHAPGQEENAAPLPEGYIYPSMDQLAEQVDAVLKFYGVVTFVGIGVGSGANVLTRYALKFPEMVDGLFLINPCAGQASWTEWFYQKVNLYYMRSIVPGVADTFPQSAQDYLMWHHFGLVTEERNRDLVDMYRRYFTGKNHNIRNLAMFTEAFLRRTDLGIDRSDKTVRALSMPTLLVVGAFSPHVDDVVNMNGRCNPLTTTWMKISDCGMVLEEQPAKVFEAFRLFLQGIGYALTVCDRRRSGRLANGGGGQRGGSLDGDGGGSSSTEEVDLAGNRVHIVENPIPQC
ncbi:Protein ndrg3 [Tyrophagus putrescentiae]|nr:Protein ndrg3 [Tyrophagus putrescentiae]